MNMTVTNNDLGSVVLKDPVFRDELLNFTGAGTVAEGTILARDSVSKKLVLFVKGGATNENGIPKAIMTYDVTASGAGDVPVRAAVGGTFKKGRLIIAADENDSNIDAAVLDQLRDYGLYTETVQNLSVLDN